MNASSAVSGTDSSSRVPCLGRAPGRQRDMSRPALRASVSWAAHSSTEGGPPRCPSHDRRRRAGGADRRRRLRGGRRGRRRARGPRDARRPRPHDGRRPGVAHEGPHVFYADGPHWRWLAERDLVGPAATLSLADLRGVRLHRGGRLRRTPPAGVLPMAAHRRRRAPVDRDFYSWASALHGEAAARAAANFLGVVTYDADPGRLSAAFVWDLLLRVTAPRAPRSAGLVGGWPAVVDRLAGRARELGVRIATSSRVDTLPDRPVIVATQLESARALLGDDDARLGERPMRAARRRPASPTGATRSSSPTSTTPVWSSASAAPTPRSPRPGTRSCRPTCRSSRVNRGRGVMPPGAPVRPRRFRGGATGSSAARGGRRRTFRRPGPAGLHLARPARDRPGRRGVPGRRPRGRARDRGEVSINSALTAPGWRRPVPPGRCYTSADDGGRPAQHRHRRARRRRVGGAPATSSAGRSGRRRWRRCAVADRATGRRRAGGREPASKTERNE